MKKHIWPNSGGWVSLVWTPEMVEAETMANYQSFWPPWVQWPGANSKLNAWNRAVSLGGEHYKAWRRENIEPIEQANRTKLCLWEPYEVLGGHWEMRPRDWRDKRRVYYLNSYVPKRAP